MTLETYDNLKQYVGNNKDNFTDDLLNMGYTKGYKQGRAEVIDSINDNIHEIYKCQFYCMGDMCEHDRPTVYMCINCFYDAISKSLEQLKEHTDGK